MAESMKLKILSLDGGGIRGLSSLVILKNIMDRVGARMVPPQEDLRPCDYFDLIGGTSTGGIIAIMLGRLRMNVDECIREYLRLGEKVFSEPRSLPNEYMFDATKLEDAVKEVLREKLGEGREDEPLSDPLGNEGCKTLVFTLPYKAPASAKPTALRSYSCKHAPRPEPYTIWQAARATSAAPTFFAPLQTGIPPNIRRWVDAGMGFNNPAGVIVEEAGRIWGDDFGHLDPNRDISIFLTLGTGFKNVVRFDADTFKEKVSAKLRVPLKAVEVMKEIVTGTETQHTSLRTTFQARLDIYHRFNVEQGLQDVELYDYQQTEAIQTDTENYLTSKSVELTTCVIEMAKLSLKQKLLESRDNSEEVFGTTGGSDDANLVKRLQALRIDIGQFNHNAKRFEASDSYRHSFGEVFRTSASYMWNAVILADILDKQGRLILEDLGQEERLRPHNTGRSDFGSSGDDASMINARRRMNGYEKLHEAVINYRHLFYATDSHLRSESLEHCWVANRLGGILEIFGLREEALGMYERARDGRMKHSPRHKATIESTKRAMTLRSALRK